MIRKLFRILSYVLVIALIIIMVGFSVKKNNSNVCDVFDITIKYSGDNFFVDKSDIRDAVYNFHGNVVDKKLSDISLEKIEDIVNNIVYVEDSYSYITTTGRLHLVVKLRKPIIRVISSENNSFYIDNNGRLLPLSDKHTARVPVAFGNISATYSPLLDFQNEESFNDLTDNEKQLKQVYQLAAYIYNDSFWESLIDQVYINNNGEAEIIPKGNIHVVEFGKLENIDYKFNKLKVFYKNGLTQVGWHRYNRVNLKYNNQIVCSK